MAKKKHPEYKVGQTVCRTYKGLTPKQKRLAVAEVGLVAKDNRGREHPAIRAWNIHSDGSRGQKPGAFRRPTIWLLNEIGPCTK